MTKLSELADKYLVSVIMWGTDKKYEIDAKDLHLMVVGLLHLQNQNKHLKLASDKLYLLMVDDPKTKKLADMALDSVYGKGWRDIYQVPEDISEIR